MTEAENWVPRDAAESDRKDLERKKLEELEARVGIVVASCRNFVVPAERCVVCFSKLQTIIPKTMRWSWLLRHAQVRCLRAIVHSRCSAGSQRSFLQGLRA
jgi:hypothetical protein